MKYLKQLILSACIIAALLSCDDNVNPLSNIIAIPRYVEFSNASVFKDTLNEGTLKGTGSYKYGYTVVAPQSAGVDLFFKISFDGGTAVYGTDFLLKDYDPADPFIVSADATGAVILVKFAPTKGLDLVLDQSSFYIEFPTDGVKDGSKDLIMTLVEATSPNIDYKFIGGKGELRKVVKLNIKDIN